MPKVYQINPAIGIMRVGDSPDAFFVGPEVPDQSGVELTAAGETPVQKYKAAGRINVRALKQHLAESRRRSAEQSVRLDLALKHELSGTLLHCFSV